MSEREKGVIVTQARYPRHVISTGMFIRDHLLEVVEDYIYHMWRLFKEAKRNAGSYQNFRNYIFWLVRLELIRFTREEPPKKVQLKPRRYYTYVPENIDEVELWRDPRGHLYQGRKRR